MNTDISKSKCHEEDLAFSRFILGALGFSLAFLAAIIMEFLFFSLLDAVFNTQFLPRGLGWVVLPFVSGSAGYKIFQQLDFKKLLTSTIRTSSQRRAFLTLCCSIAALVIQLAVYSANLDYWRDFWDGISNCLSFGFAHRYCDNSMSRFLMYVNLTVIGGSLICMICWQQLSLLRKVVQDWIKEGADK
jgi:hypothetical protein